MNETNGKETESKGAAAASKAEAAATPPADDSRAAGASGPDAAAADPAAALRAECAQLREQAQRAQAELVNFQTRARREREAERRYRNESLLRDLFPVLDNFDRALASASAAPEVKALLDGVRLVQREVFRVLDLHGVKPYDCDGQAFDPARQEVLEMVEDPSVPDKQVVATLRKGYLLHDRVVQPARVRIAVRPAAVAEAAAEAPPEPKS